MKLGGLSYVFSTDREVLRINRDYLKHDFRTDVITFDLSDSKQEVQGEVYISVDRVKQNAKHFKVTFSQELYRVIFHAALHLCGYDDKNSGQRATMKKEENKYLAQYSKLFHVKQSN
jgi:rRNA maturation RNase YbeY